MNVVVGGIEMPLPHKRRTNVVRHRLYGAVSNSAGTYTFHLTRQAPGHFDAVKLIFTGAASSGANAFRASFAPSAKVGNGYVPVTSADAAIAPTPLTWGSTSGSDFRNPGGGAATVLIQNAAGSGVDLIEGRVESDWLAISSLDRADDATKPPLYIVRVHGPNVPAIAVTESSSAATNPISVADPGFFAGYWAADNTLTADPGSAPSQGWIPCLEVVFCLRGQRQMSIGVAGDSVDQGWIMGHAVPQFGGNVDGWPRRLARKLNLAGIPTAFSSFAQTGNKSKLFHNRAYNALLASHVGLTHLFIKPWSTNEAGDGAASVPPAIARTNQLIALCEARGVVPIIVQPWAGQAVSTAAGAAVRAYCDQLRAGGVYVFDARRVVSTGSIESDSMRDEYKTRDAGGYVIDGTHLNDLGHEAVASFAFENRKRIGLF